eukprot:6207318-Pleurochrysis_carterae.AAC.3
MSASCFGFCVNVLLKPAHCAPRDASLLGMTVETPPMCRSYRAEGRPLRDTGSRWKQQRQWEGAAHTPPLLDPCCARPVQCGAVVHAGDAIVIVFFCMSSVFVGKF